MGRGTHRGFITFDELNKSLGKRNLSDENLEQAFMHILDESVALVEKKSDFKVLRKKENSSKEEGKTIEKSDDPIRMYLREMGGVELLSREGEIAIAKRIEAGKDVMLIALAQSPITAQQFVEWDEKLQSDEILVREIIDIDTNYMEDENTGPSAKQRNSGETDKNDENNGDDDEFNPTLAAMETEIKPKVLKTVNTLTKEYAKLIKYQKEKLDCILNAVSFSAAKEKGHDKIVSDILENIKSLQLSPSVLEELVQKHYVENKKIVSLEGNLLRLAMDQKISRNEMESVTSCKECYTYLTEEDGKVANLYKNTWPSFFWKMLQNHSVQQHYGNRGWKFILQEWRSWWLPSPTNQFCYRNITLFKRGN